jgi:hypothetical protein
MSEATGNHPEPRPRGFLFARPAEPAETAELIAAGISPGA